MVISIVAILNSPASMFGHYANHTGLFVDVVCFQTNLQGFCIDKKMGGESTISATPCPYTKGIEIK